MATAPISRTASPRLSSTSNVPTTPAQSPSPPSREPRPSDAPPPPTRIIEHAVAAPAREERRGCPTSPRQLVALRLNVGDQLLVAVPVQPREQARGGLARLDVRVSTAHPRPQAPRVDRVDRDAVGRELAVEAGGQHVLRRLADPHGVGDPQV